MKENEPEKRPLFNLGQVVATPGFLSAAERNEEEPLAYLFKHVTGNWGDLPEQDKEANEEALAHGGRIFSAYHLADGTKFYLITEHDRSYTTFLLPSEY